MPTYKTTDGNDYLLPEIGRTVQGKITVPEGTVIENRLFELVADEPAPVAPASTPAAVVPPSAPAPVTAQAPVTPAQAPTQTPIKEIN